MGRRLSGPAQRAGRSLPAAWYVFRRLLRQGYERLVHGQAMLLQLAVGHCEQEMAPDIVQAEVVVEPRIILRESTGPVRGTT